MEGQRQRNGTGQYAMFGEEQNPSKAGEASLEGPRPPDNDARLHSRRYQSCTRLDQVPSPCHRAGSLATSASLAVPAGTFLLYPGTL